MLHELWSKVGKDWRDALGTNGIAAFERLSRFLAEEAGAGHRTFPALADVFNALRLTPLAEVKVVILGQDPFFNPGEAHGLSFSVRHGVEVPTSTRSIYTALERDIPFVRPGHGNLGAWARRGVLLLNTILTVREGEAKSHAGKGWKDVTDAIIRAVNAKRDRVVFMLWGGEARKRRRLVTAPQHAVLTSSHPASRGRLRQEFFDSGHFSKANELLRERGRGELDWNLPERRSVAKRAAPRRTPG